MFLSGVARCQTSPFGERCHFSGCKLSMGSILNFAYMEMLDSMFVHLAVPITSSAAFLFRATSAFSYYLVTHYCRDFTNYECTIDTFATTSFHVARTQGCRSC